MKKFFPKTNCLYFLLTFKVTEQNNNERCLQFIEILVQAWETVLKTLAFTDILHNGVWFGGWISWISWEDLPMVEHALWESLSSGVGSVKLNLIKISKIVIKRINRRN